MILEDTLLTGNEYIKHAANVAEKHKQNRYGAKNIPNVEKCEEAIYETYNRIMSSGLNESALKSIPSDEWIADNYHIVQEAAESVNKEDYKRKLLAMYDVAAEIASHTDGSIGEREILSFVAAYEKVRPFETASLVYLCPMLQLALIKRIAEICKFADKIYRDRKSAERIFREFCLHTKDKDDKSIRSASVLFDNEDMISPVFAEAILRFSAEQEQNDTVRLALSGKLAAKGTTIEELIEREHKARIALGVSMGNAIRSLRALPSLNWDKIMSELCITEQILRKDPAGIYSDMTSKSRNEYLRVVAVCAKRKGVTPEQYSLEVLERAEKEQKHVGEYIYNDYTKQNDFGSFFIMFLFTSAILAFCPAVYTFKLAMKLYGTFGSLLGAFCVLLILPAVMNVSLSLIQKMYIDKKMPFSLPEMDFKGKLPENCKIMIVLPCLLNSRKRVDEMVKQLEAAYWANPQNGIYYTLLADLPESSTKTTEKDSEIINYAKQQTEKLGENFRLFIRERTYYKEDDKWIGFERKRGALLELNRAIINGDLPKVNYVLTVDADTIIPINTAIKMAQIMHHPLNRPHVDYVKGEAIVTRGYGLLQPAVNPSGLDRENSTIFEKIYCEETGFDSYRCKTSDFYFDVCHEGIYTGKGMYDPYVFNSVLDGRFEKNSILSHDLLEGSFVRTGFVSDVHLYDSFPRTYAGYVKREHRWIRGDWQLLPFLGKRFKNEKGVLKNNPLNFYSRFKIAMNLLRSILPVSLYYLFVIGIILLREDDFLWLFIVIATLLLTSGGKFVMRIVKTLCNFALLPHTAYYHMDAIVRAIYRTFCSRKNMLEWVVSSDAEKGATNTPGYYSRFMWKNYLSAATVSPFMFGIPCLLWLAGPLSVYFFSLKPTKKATPLTDIQVKKYRITARKIWAFYDDYAVESENYLPPDNVQFSPVYCVAHRTSPTNIGFLIVSVVLAESFGYISKCEMISRLDKIVNTVEKLQKWKGHIFNWYDTLTLNPLNPIYVSAVDSGNLVACLLAAAAMAEEKISVEESLKEKVQKTAQGLLDTIYCLNELARDDDKIETWLLEEFLKKDASAEDVEIKEDFLRIIYHYNNIAEYARGEKADPHSYRCSLKRMLESAEKNVAGEAINLQNETKILVERMRKLALDTDFAILYNDKQKHIRIGYNYSTGEFSESYYDMLMSEARLTSYVAMAKGDVEAEHFSSLARRFNNSGKVLLSWSGTVFEYVLPELFMPSPYGSSLNETIYEMLKIQQEIAGEKPWGVSESGYNALDVNMNYKYKAFGLKSLAVKRMYNDDTVVAPYASLMASSHVPQDVYRNMENLTKMGAEGKYGFYEAVDFTPSRRGFVESFMSHHVGMAFCGISNLLFDKILARSFSGLAMMRSVSVMLTEKNNNTIVTPKSKKTVRVINEENEEKQVEQAFCISGEDIEILSNGKYSVVMNAQGRGFSTFCDIGIDVHRENIPPEGMVFYLNGTMMKPVKCTLQSGNLEYLYLYESEEVIQKICVAADENSEIRTIKITNKGNMRRYENITVYCRLMMDFPASFNAHPSYSNMFITTEVLKNDNSGLFIKAVRRKHKPTDPHIESFFLLNIPLESKNEIESIMYDTDVLSFKGRNNSIESPVVFKGLDAGSEVLLAGNTGTVFNPCFAVNIKLCVDPGESKTFLLSMGVCSKNGEIDTKLANFDKFANAERFFELARTRCFIEKEHVALKKGDLQYFRGFAPKFVYGKKFYSENIKQKLWQFGISGDNPIITVMLKKMENAVHLERLIRMWCFYSFRGIKLDLILSIFDNSDYLSPIHELAESLAQKAMWGCFSVRGNIFVVAPKDSDAAHALIEASNVVLWL